MKMPVEVFLSYTTKCNLHCKHCYSNSGINGKTIDEEKILKVLSEIRPLRIVISGGDPLIEFNSFLRFLKRYKEEYKINSYVVLATNGTLVNEDRLKKLNGYVDRFQISLDTLSKEKFIKIRGMDLLNETIRGIREVKRLNMDIQIAFSLFKDNINEIEKIIEFCLENKIDKINVLRQRPSGRSKSDLTREEIKEAYLKFINYTQNKNIKLIIHDPIANTLGIYSECSAAKEIVAIDTKINFKPCPLFNSAVKGNFKEIWNTNELFKETRKMPKECYTCKIKNCKGGCKACSFNIRGKVSKDPWCLK